MNNLNGLQDAIKRAVDEVIKQEIENEIKGCNERIEKAVRARVGTIAANVANRFNYQAIGHELVIRVHFDNFGNVKP